MTAEVRERDVRVLVADDSLFMRHLVRRALESDPRVQVIGEARDGLEAVEKNAELQPSVIVMDVQMPRMDGLSALRKIMTERPIPVVMFSSLTTENAQVTLEALSLGAVDFMPKPENRIDLSPISEELCRKVVAAHSANLRPRWRRVRPAGKDLSRRRETAEADSLVVIGSSTGGPQALDEIIPKLPPGFPGSVLVCQHMPAGFTASMAGRLDSLSSVSVKEAEEGDKFYRGTVLVAPGGVHSEVVTDGGGQARPLVHLSAGEPVHGVRPSVDVSLVGAAQAFGPKLLVVILTGMGLDGARGAKAAKALGATVLCQDESTSVVWGMPRACVEIGACDEVLPLHRIARAVQEFVDGVEGTR